MNSMKLKHVAFILFVLCLSIFLPCISDADPLENWHLRVRTQEKFLQGVTYGNNTFVAVGYNGTILTSPDGMTWTSRTSGTTYDLNGVAYGNGIFVAVGYVGTILTSPDGITWNSRASGASSSLDGVTYGNGTFVAVGFPWQILTSPDGITWTTRRITKKADSHCFTGCFMTLYSVAYGNSIFVAVGDFGTILTSADGITWTERNSGTNNFLFGVTYGNNTFVAVGDHGTILTSADGTAWTSGYPHSEMWASLLGVTYNNGTFVAVGFSQSKDFNGYFNVIPTILSLLPSTNIITWTDRTSENGFLNGVAYGNGTFVAVGYPGAILQSDPVNGTCTATLSEDLSLHIPIIEFNGQPYWADFQYASNLDLELKDAGVITDISPFSGCTPSSMSSDLSIHIPFLNFYNLSFWVDFEHKEGLLVTLTNAGRN